VNKYPVIKIVILFILGIITSYFVNLHFLYLLITLLILLLSVWLLASYLSNKFYMVTILLAGIIPLTFGMLIYNLHKDSGETKIFAEKYLKNVLIIGTIEKIELYQTGEINFVLKGDSIKNDNQKQKIHASFNCRIQSTSEKKLKELYQKLLPGNYISLKGNYFANRAVRNPGEFDYNSQLLKKGIIGFVNCYESENLKIIDNKKYFFQSAIHQVRKNIAATIVELFDKKTAGLLKGLLLADRSEISSQTKTEFINSGVIHVLAVSGLHVGFITIIFLFLFERNGIYYKTILTILGLFFFLVLTGSAPSVFRAVIMASVYLLAKLIGRDTNGYNSISIAAFIILMINPDELFNPGFQLSFAAVLSILLLNPFFVKWVEALHIQNKLLKYLLMFVGVSLSAQIGTLPFTNYYFGKLSIIAVAANILVIPATALIVGIGIAGIIVSQISTSIASVIAITGNLVSFLMTGFVNYSASQSFSFIRINNFSIIDILLYYVFFISFFVSVRYFKNSIVKTILFALFFCSFIVYASLDNKQLLPDGKLSVMMIDVGQGDAILIKLPNKKIILIDAGNALKNYDYSERVIVPLLDYLSIDKIDYGIITHMDKDHFAGFIYLIANNKVRSLIKTSAQNSKKEILFDEFVKRNKVNIQLVNDTLFKIANTRLYVFKNIDTSKIKNANLNDKSIVLKLVYGSTSFLFTGDAGFIREKLLIRRYGSFLDSDVLKVGHHGSKYCTSIQFVEFVNPEICLISSGALNRFGHPSKEVLNRINNSKIFRTDVEGAILLQSDGKNINKINWKNF